MNIEWVIPCRHVEVHDNLGTIVGAGIDHYWMPSLPAQVVVPLAVRLTAVADELGSDPHTVRNVISDPAGETISDVSGEVAIQGESARPDWLTGVVLAALASFEAVTEGTYRIELFVDQASQAVPIHVVHGQMPGAPSA